MSLFLLLIHTFLYALMHQWRQALTQNAKKYGVQCPLVDSICGQEVVWIVPLTL